MLFIFAIFPVVIGTFLTIKYWGFIRDNLQDGGIGIVCLFYSPALVSLVIAAITYGINSSEIRDREYWGGYITSIRHEEAWNEYIHATCYRTESCGKDCTTLVPYDCSYVQYHPDLKIGYDSNGETHYISDNLYYELRNRFGNEKKIGRHHGYTISGDILTCQFGGADKDMYTVVTEHTYRNPTQIANNVISFPVISDKEARKMGLYEYPKPGKQYELYAPSVLGMASTLGERKLDLLNAKYGKQLQLKVFILIFDDKPQTIFQDQRNYWRNGNKNEFVICIGRANGKITWADVFSWTDSDYLLNEVKNKLAMDIDKQFHLSDFCDYLEPKLLSGWKRKPFHDFDYLLMGGLGLNSYLWNFLLTFLVTIGCLFFVEYDVQSKLY